MYFFVSQLFHGATRGKMRSLCAIARILDLREAIYQYREGLALVFAHGIPGRVVVTPTGEFQSAWFCPNNLQ